jgi:DNA-binding GntR family transcriptional regulator
MRAHLAHDYRVVAGEDAVARGVFPLLGRLAPPETLTVQQAAGRLGEDRSRVFRALERLVDAQLAETPRSGHYRAPGLLRHFAAELQLVAG